MADMHLTAEQEAQAQQLADLAMDRTRDEVLHMARLLEEKRFLDGAACRE